MEKPLHIELVLNKTLIARAHDVTGIDDMSALVTEALRAIIARESAKALACIGGSEPHIRQPRRR